MTIKDNIVYLTEAELKLVKQARAANWAAPEIYLKEWLSRDKPLTESLDVSFYKTAASLINKNNYKIVE